MAVLSRVKARRTASSWVKVTLRTALGLPIRAKRVILVGTVKSPNTARTRIEPVFTTTNAKGVAVFQVSDTLVQKVTYRATDLTDGVVLGGSATRQLREAMRGVILAGGTGSRLYPLTRITNKHLLPIGDRPMISYGVEALVKAGVTEIMVVTGGTHAGEFLRLLVERPGVRRRAPPVRLPGAGGRHRRGPRPGGPVRR